MQFAALPCKINLIIDMHIKLMSQSLRRHLSLNILEQTQQGGISSAGRARGRSQPAFMTCNCVPLSPRKMEFKR